MRAFAELERLLPQRLKSLLFGRGHCGMPFKGVRFRETAGTWRLCGNGIVLRKLFPQPIAHCTLYSGNRPDKPGWPQPLCFTHDGCVGRSAASTSGNVQILAGQI